MESFDQGLKYLVHHDPADFLRFALARPAIDVIESLPAALPSRGRDVDGCYLISLDGEPTIAHFEFHRRNQSLDELATDIAEAQIRLFRREDKLELTLLWDLYGSADEPFLEDRTLRYGRAPGRRGSEAAYSRVNLRAIVWTNFLHDAPPVLWPLVPLTKGGANEQAVMQARDAIEARTDLGFSEQLDYLAILRFIAEAEDMPQQILEAVLAKEEAMSSGLYESAVAKGEARGLAKGIAEGIVQGEAKALAGAIVRMLRRRMGVVKSDVRKRILSETNVKMLRRWLDLASDAMDAESAQRVVDTIRKARHL